MTAGHHCRGAPSSRHFLLFRSYAPAHMCAEKNARARKYIRVYAHACARTRTHPHIHIIVKNVVLATQHEQSFTPVHSSPRVTLWSFEGSEGRGCRSERERGFAGVGGRRGVERRRRGEKGRKRGTKGKREARPVCVGWHFYWSLGIRCPHHR